MKSKNIPGDGRETILARIREATKTSGVRSVLPVPASGGRDGLPPSFDARQDRVPAFARMMDELHVSFVLCDTLRDVADGLASLAERSNWKKVAVQDAPLLRTVADSMGDSVLRVSSGRGSSEMGDCDAGLVEGVALDAQTGGVFVGGASGLSVAAIAPTLVVVALAESLAPSLDSAFHLVSRGGRLPEALAVLTGGAVSYGAERRIIANGHGAARLVVYLALAER